jgi:hypothetical protein
MRHRGFDARIDERISDYDVVATIGDPTMQNMIATC